MSSSESRSQMINPFMVKAGIPAALSIAAYFCAKFISKRSNLSTTSQSLPQQHIQYETFHSLNSNPSYDNEHYQGGDDIARLQTNNVDASRDNLENKLLELENRAEYLQIRERDLRVQFLQYQATKERQFMLLELRYKMIIEKIRAEFLVKEMCLVQDETKRMGGLIMEIIKLVQKLEDSKKENGLLESKARKLCIKGRQRLKKIRVLKLRLEAREMKILSYEEEVQRKDDVIQGLEDEVTQLKEVIEYLQRQKIEMSSIDHNLDVAHKPYSLNSENNGIGVTKEEHNKVLKELETLKMDHETKANEVTFLRWSNACLRHELLKFHEQNKDENAEKLESLEHQHVETEDCDCNTTIITTTSHDCELCLGNTHTNTNTNAQLPSKRRRFIQKVKKWVEGGSFMDPKEKDNEVKCFGKHSICEEGEDLHVNPRMSCSSV